MSDPTVPVLITAFSGAIGVFVLAALVRWSRSRGQSSDGVPEIHASPSSGEILPPPQPGFFPNVTPYQPPASQPALVPPPVPSGVPVWPYRAIDFILAAVIVGIFGALSIATAMTDPEKMEFSAVALISSIVLQFTLAGITLSFVIWRIGPVAWLGLNWKNWPWVFLLAPAVVGVMWLVFGGLQLAGYMKWIESFGVESLQDSVKLLQTSKDTVVLALMAVAAVVVAPVCEELIFRGYLFAFAKKYTGTWVAAICSGLIFAAAHGSLAALLPLFIFGIVLALLYEKTGSIWAPIAVHFCFNGATVGIQFLARQFPQLLEQAPK